MSFGSATLKPKYWSQVILETSIVTCAWAAVAARNPIRIIILIVLMTARFMIDLHHSVRPYTDGCVALRYRALRRTINKVCSQYNATTARRDCDTIWIT